MSSIHDQSSNTPVSKVTLSPVKDSTGKTDALLVTIKRVENPTTEDISQNIRFQSPSGTLNNRVKSRRLQSRSTTVERKKYKTGMDTSKESAASGSSTISVEQGNKLCTRHAALKLGRKKSDIPSEKISLCNNCSKSMLSYIFMVQDFLDSLAREISCENSSIPQCLECVRETLNIHSDISSASQLEHSIRNDSKTESNLLGVDKKIAVNRTNDSSDDKDEHDLVSSPGKRAPRGQGRERGPRRETKKLDQQKDPSERIKYDDQQVHKLQTKGVGFLHSASPSSSAPTETKELVQGKLDSLTSDLSNVKSSNSTNTDQYSGDHNDEVTDALAKEMSRNQDSSADKEFFSHSDSSRHSEHDTIFRPSMERQQPNFNESMQQEHYESKTYTDNNVHQGIENPPSLFADNVDGMMSTLSNLEREVYDDARDRAGWERLTELQEGQCSTFSDGQNVSEAYVTMARNNAEALGCLVLGTSLRLCGTSRSLCVLLSDGVSPAFRAPLSSIFHVLQYVRSLDSLGTTKLGLLKQPELGVSFDKLNVWRLTQFSKCVYLNPDMLVIQNCDELFCHEELSAVPDIGWPDCFNSGLFVFSPSNQTFWKLLEFAEHQGSYDGGDQGLLNTYFNTWSHDIHKKLSFIYNLMANVSYTYTPAFKQFGRNVKVVQFLGSFKPWHVKFFSSTGQIAPASAVHPTYVQFVHMWLKIFRIKVLQLFSQEIQTFASSQNVISASELLRFFSMPLESEMDFLLSPPSVRLHVIEKQDHSLGSITKDHAQKLRIASNAERKRRQSAEFPQSTSNSQLRPRSLSTDNSQDTNITSCVIGEGVTIESATKTSQEASIGDLEISLAKSTVSDSHQDGNILEKNRDSLPGSEIGDYQGMRAWEQGRMDYQGSDSSENIIKRLHFLMSQPQHE